MTTTLRHQPTEGCNGEPGTWALMPDGGVRYIPFTCRECGNNLCPCESTFGHDCEDKR